MNQLSKKFPPPAKSLEEVTRTCKVLLAETGEALSVARLHGLALGWYIVKFSETETVVAEKARLDALRSRGRKWEPHNLAAKMVSDHLNDERAFDWFRKCAQGVMDFKKRFGVNTLETTTYEDWHAKAMNWRQSAVNSMPSTLLLPPPEEGEGDPSDPVDPDIEALLANTGKALSKKILSLIVKTQAAKKRLSPKAWEKVFNPVNQELQRIGYAIARRG